MQDNVLARFRADAFFNWAPEPACMGCRYYRPIYDHGPDRKQGGMVCHYLLDTGRMRGCPFGAGCKRWEV